MTKLPASEIYVSCKTAPEVAKAIKTMVIRGAPAIGVAAAMGIALAMKRSKAAGTRQCAVEFNKVCEVMAATRTRLAAQNARWLELPTVWDVDTPADLSRLAADNGFKTHPMKMEHIRMSSGQSVMGYLVLLENPPAN